MPKVSRSEYRAILAKAKARKAKRASNARFILLVANTVSAGEAKTARVVSRYLASRKSQARGLNRKKSLIKQLDTLWSDIVRRRDRREFGPNCRICFNRPATLAYHITPKQRGFAVRWDLDNGCGACAPCNLGEMMNRSLYRDRHIKIFGREKIEVLEAKAITKVKFSTADLLAKRDEFRKILEAGA